MIEVAMERETLQFGDTMRNWALTYGLRRRSARCSLRLRQALAARPQCIRLSRIRNHERHGRSGGRCESPHGWSRGLLLLRQRELAGCGAARGYLR